jgi:hypothetical protein
MKAGQGTAMTMQGIKDASYNRGLKAAQDKAKAEKGGQKAGEAGAQALKDKTTQTKKLPDIDAIAKMDRSKVKKSGKTAMIKKNIDRFGKDRVQHLQNKQQAFKAMKKGEMSKADFIDKFPNSITAQKAKGLRDHTEWDAYDMVLEYLFSTEQVTSLEEANYVMMEMDQQTIGEIVKEVKDYLQESPKLKAAGALIGGLAGKAVGSGGKAAPTGGTARGGDAAGSKAAPEGSKRYGTAAGPRKDELAGRKAGPKGSIRKSGTATAPMK